MADRSDGSVLIEADFDINEAEKQLNRLKKKISETEREIESMRKERFPLAEQSNRLSVSLERAASKLNEMKNASVGMFTKDQISEQAQTVKSLQYQYDQIQSKVEQYDRKLETATKRLNRQKTEAGELIQEIESVSRASRAMAAAQASAAESAKRFKMRIREVVRSALVFTLIAQSLAKFREWMGKVIRTNDEATVAFSRLKGALLTLAQPLVEVILPAFTAFVNVLAAVVAEVAKLFSALFGMTIDQSAEAAKSLKAEADALDDTGAAAKKAGKSLASFDEINKLSGNSQSASGAGAADTETIVPDFSWLKDIEDRMQRIAQAVLLIAAGLALWKIASTLPGMLGTILTHLAGILIAIGGLILAYEGFTDAWKNGVDWGNLATMIAGVAAAAAGLYLALGPIWGPIAAGIALVVGGIAMLVTGFKDVIDNGATLQNTLLIIAGIIAAGLGLKLLTGSWIPLVLAGILAVITAFVAWQGNMEEFAEAFKNIFGGIVDFFTGVFTGDMELAIKGIKNVVIGAINAIVIAFESFVNTIIDGLNWLIQKANSIADAVGIGSFIPSIPKVELPRIPYLAQGAVIPPNREFLAVLGDQKSGTNIETPLSTMIDAFKTAMQSMNMGGGQNEAVLMVDDEVLGKIVYRLYNKEDRRVGVSLSTSRGGRP